jgi:hypothetical protein
MFLAGVVLVFSSRMPRSLGTGSLMSRFRSRARLTVTLALAVAGAAVGVAATVPPASAAYAASSVTPSATAPAALAAMACRSAKDCMAVGSNTPTMATQLAAEQWNGKKWTRLPMLKPAGVVNAGANGVACPAARVCVAVGDAFPANGPGPYALAGYWNGARWTTGRAAAPGSSSELIAISCPTAASCYAVGEYNPKGKVITTAALIEHWNGKSWAQQTAPMPHGAPFGQLVAVSCATVKFCVAVGTTGAGELIERWNGNAWIAAVPAAPADTNLWGVSCPTAASCYAVGGTGSGTVIERWNGKAWSRSAAPVPAHSTSPFLQSVSCVSSARCLAVGDDLNNSPTVFADQWNGTTWKPVSMTTSGPRLGDFEQVQCLGATTCVALGSASPFSAAWRSESAFWNGKSWKVVPTV